MCTTGKQQNIFLEPEDEDGIVLLNDPKFPPK
jgi:hypothetical protein